MPKIISKKIKINNTNNITYVLKKFDNNTYKLFTYQKNASTGCYYLVGSPQTGFCI